MEMEHSPTFPEPLPSNPSGALVKGQLPEGCAVEKKGLS